MTVHVTRADARPTNARLQMRVGTRWVLVKEKFVSARAFVFKTEPSLNRTMLRVVLPQRHVASHAFAAPQPAPLVRRVSYARRGRLVDGARPGGDAPLRRQARPGPAARYQPGRLTGVQVRPSAWSVRARRPGTPGALAPTPHRSYRFEVVPCWGHGYGRTSVDVTQVRLVPLTLDAAPVVLHRSVGVTEIGVVTLPSTGRVMVRGWQYDAPLWTGLTTPTGVTVGGYSASPVYLEAGKTLTDGSTRMS